MEKATFAAGCFRGVEDSFRSLAGVLSTRVEEYHQKYNLKHGRSCGF